MRANPVTSVALAMNLNRTTGARSRATWKRLAVFGSLAMSLSMLLALALPAAAQSPQTQASPRTQSLHPAIAFMPEPRITEPVDPDKTVAVKNSVLRKIRTAKDLGPIPGNTPMQGLKLVFVKSPAQQAALDQLLAEQQNPASPNYHKWVTPEEFGRHFGPAQADIDAVSGWLQAQGFSVAGASKGRQTLEFSGTAAQVNAAFQTAMHRFQVDGEEHTANATEVHIPAALASVVSGIARLNDFHPIPMIQLKGSQLRSPPSSFPARGAAPEIYDFFTYYYDIQPTDFYKFYNVPSNWNGAGLTIGLPEASAPTGSLTSLGNGVYGSSNYDNFNTIFGLTGGNLAIEFPFGQPPANNSDDGLEADLDAQWAHAVAPGAKVLMIPAADEGSVDGTDEGQDYMVDENLVDIISLSYANYEQSVSGADSYTEYVENRGEQAAAQGISLLAASGDWGTSGFASGDAALDESLWADYPYVTSVGGTVIDPGANGVYWMGLNVSDYTSSTVRGHVPEDGWSGSGGGVSRIYSKPAWQTGVPGIPNDSARDFPDVSFSAGPWLSYLTCLNGGCADTTAPILTSLGGTSASTPVFAGAVALLDQKYGGRQGLLNPSLYKLGAGENWGNCNGSNQAEVEPPSSCVFYDITTGSNAVSGDPSSLYSAGQGYDLVTGLGSINISELLNQWGSVSYLATTTSLSLPSSAFYGEEVSFSGTVTDPSGAGTPTGYVDLLAGGQSFGPYQLDSNGNFSGQVQGLPTGNTSVVARYGGDTTYASSASPTESIPVIKIPTSANITFQPALTTSAYGANTIGLTVAVTGSPNYGNPSGNVVLNLKLASTGTTNYVGTLPLVANVGSPGSTVTHNPALPANAPPDTYTFTATYAGDTTFAGLTSAVTGSITITKASTSLALVSSTSSTSVGSPVTLNATLQAAQGQTAPTGTVQFYQNGRAVGSPVSLANATLSGGAYSASASLTTSALYPGSFPVTAVYSGDTDDATSTSNAVTITVAGATDTVSVASNISGYDYLGSNLTLTATVFSQNTTPAITGSVQFFSNGASLGTAPVTGSLSGGKQIATASLVTSALPAGTDTVYAVYLGDPVYDPGTSFTISIPVTEVVANGYTSPSSLSFGNQTLSEAASNQEIVLGNSGTAALVFGSATITGANASSFSIQGSTCSAGSQLIPFSGRYCFFSIGFTPQQSGALSASLILTDNSPSSPHTIPLTGTGVPAGPYLQVIPASLSFGLQTVNTTSAAQTVTLTNIGNATILLNSFNLATGPFHVDTSGCSNFLAPGASCQLSFTFAPTAAGSASATSTISTNGTVQSPISLSGTGIAAQGASLLGVVHTLPGSYSSPSSVVADSHGNLYVSDTPNNAVYKVDPTGNQTALPIQGLTAPGALTIDASGNLYVVSNGGYNNVSVIKYTSASSQVAVPFNSVSSATSVAVDTSGNIYVAVPSASSVFQSAPGQSAPIQIGFAKLGVVYVNAVAIDSNNNLYVTGSTGDSYELNELPGITGTYTTIAPGLTNPVALTVGRGNVVYVADGTTNQVRAYSSGASNLVLDSPAITGVSSIFEDANFNLYLTSAGQVFEQTGLATANAGFATLGTPGSVWVTMNVPAGNSIATIGATDLAADSEWTVPSGNTCTVTNLVCSFQVKFSPVYPGLRAGAVTVTDGVGSTRTINLYGVGQGPQATLLTGNKTTIAGTWVPSALTADTAGNVYVLDQTNAAAPIIQKITPAGVVSTALDPTSAGGGADANFAVDGQGHFYLKPVNEGGGIWEYEYGGLSEVSGGSGSAGPFALDGAGNFYDTGANQVVVTDSRSNTLATYSYGSSSSVTISNIAVDSLKNIYVTTSEPAIYITSWAGVTTTLLDTTTSPGGFTLSNPTGIAVDAAGTVYVADAGANALFRIDSSGNTSALSLSLNNPSVVGLTITPQGTLYMADEANSAVYRFDAGNATLAFGSVSDETSSAVQSVLLTNTGNQPLVISALSSPAGYTQQQNSTWCTASTSLSEGGTCGLTFLLDPTSLGAANGSVTVTDNSLNGASTQSVALTGQSVVGPVSQVVFSTPPASINALQNFGQVAVQLKDLAGNVVTSSTDSVTLTVKDGSGNVFYTATSAAVSGVVTFNLSAAQVTNSGLYTFIAADTTTATATPTPTATSTVNALAQTITFGALSGQTYGVLPITLGASATSGLGISYAVTGPATVSGNTLTVTGAGLVSVTAQQSGNGTYSAAPSSTRSFTVAPALLTVTPNNTNKYVNQVVPPLTYTIAGYVNGDNVEVPVVSGAPLLSTTATVSSAAGPYPITASLGTLAAANYSFQFGTGTLTVIQPSSPITPEIGWNTPVTIPYGTPLSATQLDATSITAGTFVYSPAAGAILAGGTQTLNVTFYPTDTTDYTSATATVQLTVSPTAPTVSVTSSANPGIAGSALTFTATVTGVAGGATPTGQVLFNLNSLLGGQTQLGGATPLVNGVATFTTSSLAAGQQPYSVSVSYQSDANYSAAQSGNLAQVVDPEASVGSSTTFPITVFVGAGSGTVNTISVGASGAPGQDFSLVSAGTCAAGASLASNGNCTANIKFTPTRSGVRYGAITLTDASGNIITTNQLAGIGLGPQVGFVPGTQSTIGSGFNQPGGVAVDAAGNVYVADSLHGQVLKQPAGGGTAVVVDNSLSFPTGLAVDGAGNVYVADAGNSRVVVDTLTSSGYVQSTVSTSSLSNPNAVAVDYNGDLFIADTGNNRILEEVNSQFTSSLWTESVITTSALESPSAIAVDAAGNLFIADTYNSRILEESPTSGGYTESTIADSDTLINPLSVAVDGNGNVYFADFSGNGVYKATPSGSGYTQTTLPLDPSIVPGSMALDGQGNLYHNNVNGNLIYEEDYADAPQVGFATATNVGSTDTTDGPQTVSLFNLGNQPLTFASHGISYPASFPFNTSDAGLCSASLPLAAGSSCDISANFAPTVGGLNSGSVVLTDNALNVTGAMQSIPFSGTGVLNAIPATITSPAANSAFTGPSVTFNWTAAQGATSYYLWIGTTGAGSNNLYNSAAKTVTSYTFSSMPTNGETIYVRLTTNYNGTWVHTDYTYTAAAQALLTSPVAGSTFPGRNVTFTWSASPSATGYYLLIGSTGAGSNNLYNSEAKNVTSYTFPYMPTNGETIYVRLTTNFSGTWISKDYTFVAAGTPASMTAPAAGSTLTGRSATFTWSAPAGATGYYLWIGTTGVGSNNLYNSEEKAVNTYTFNGLPTDGETIYVRLITNYNGIWVSNYYTYTATAPAAITSPAAGSVLPGPSVTFTWSAASGATSYYLQIGTTGVGSSNLYSSAPKTVTSYTFNRMPTNGETIYFRLITNFSGTWLSKDYTFKAATPAAITAPAAGTAFTGPSATFQWSAPPGATGYYLLIGTTGVGADDLYNSAQKTVNTYTFSTLPTNGETIYVRLITNYNGTWVWNDYTYSAASQAVMTSPAAGSTLPGASVPFSWTAASGATGYYLQIGSTGVGSSNIYNSAQKTGTTYTYPTMPTNGETIYVRLITNYNGPWVHNDYSYTAAP